MAERLEGLSIGLDLETIKVSSGLQDLKSKLTTVNSEMKANMSAFDRGEQSITKYETRIKGLNKKLEVQKAVTDRAYKSYTKMVKEHGEGSKQAEKAAKEYNNQSAALKNLERYVNRTKDEMAKFKEQQRIANSNWTKMGNKLETVGSGFDKAGDKMSSFGQTLSTSVTAPIVGFGTLAVESTRELRQDMARLETNAKQAGTGVDVMEKSMRDLNAITGETDSNVEALSNLMATGMSDNQLLQAVDDLSGAVIKFPDTLKIEGLADGLQETLATGKAIGPFAELLERMGVDLETFDEGLAEATESGDALNYVLDELNDLDLSKVNKEFRETNKELVEGRNAQYDFMDALSELGEKLEPIAARATASVAEIIDKFNELEPEVQDNILKFAGLTAAAGPTLAIFGKLTTGTGALIKGMGSLSKKIGVAKGTGAAASIARLGKGGVVGLAIAGVAALGIGIYKLTEKSKESKEVNIDLAKSLSDQATDLENSAETFDKLSNKAKISNDELARLNDLNIRISKSSNPGEIAELQKQYDYLAKKSGLSKEELKKLFGANKNIIKQSPDVEKSISDQGNAFAKNTDEVKEYVQSLYEMSRQELSDELVIAEENKGKILKSNKGLKEEIAELDKKSKELRNLEAMSEKERNDTLRERHSEIKQQQLLHRGDQEKLNELKREEEIIVGYIKDGIGQGLEAIKGQRDALNEKIVKNDEELEKIRALNMEMTNIVLKQVGINEEGQKGLAQLDQSIVKNNEEILALEQKRQKNGELTIEEQKRYDKLVASNTKQQEAKLYIFEELGLYNNINSLLDTKLAKLSQEEQQDIKNLAKKAEIKVEEGNIVKQIQNKNDKLLETRNQLVKNLEKEGANKQEIRNQISELDTKIGKNDDVLKKILEEAGLWDQVKNKINLGSKAIDRQGGKIDNNNKKTDRGITLEYRRTKEASKDVTKKVDVTDMRTIYDLNKRAMKMIEKPVKADDNGSIASLDKKAKSPIDKVINFVAKGFKWWAHGTPPSGHPGGHAVVGDGKGANAGRELIQVPGGATFLSPPTDTIIPNLPKGSHVLPARETKRILKSAPRYAQGTKNWQSLVEPSKLRNNEFMALLALNAKDSKTTVEVPAPSGNKSKDYTKDLLDATLEQNNILMQILAKDNNVYLDSALLGSSVEPVVTEIQTMNKEVRDSFA
ncbi:hypothetical protein [Virgibacillus chiguensis]|uniref:Phage-related minor tail protein n=1 Tax=Virgibacillus chiguensis TaxID=411959 RepID=A0A1M5XRY7_9BACI|nr:hypothetical protein [Virgibacillus chiguensis]SHI02540.1 Phage-related minor tail protein [Virgibacillus chiguensis]